MPEVRAEVSCRNPLHHVNKEFAELPLTGDLHHFGSLLDVPEHHLNRVPAREIWEVFEQNDSYLSELEEKLWTKPVCEAKDCIGSQRW